MNYIKRLAAALLAVLVGTLAACSQNTAQQTVSSAQSSMESAVSAENSMESAASEENSAESIAPVESSMESAAPIGPTAESRDESVPLPSESNIPEETSVIQGEHPSYLVGQWSLRLDMSQLEASAQVEASDRMANTGMILHADGTAVGIAYDSRIDGEWGESGGYVYVTLGSVTEYFRYYIDTLDSVNYAGMSFVR